MRKSTPANVLLVVILACHLLLGCTTTVKKVVETNASPPPDLKTRPWGIGQEIALAESGLKGALIEKYLLDPTEASMLQEKLDGLTPSKEVVSEREAKLWLSNEDNELVGYLTFRKAAQGWLIESYVTDSGSSQAR